MRECFTLHLKNAFRSKNLFLKEVDLDELHSNFNFNDSLLEKGTDQSTVFHKAIYSSFDDPNFFATDFWKNYKDLSLVVLQKLKNQTGYFGEWAVQRFPTIRFHFPNNISVFEFHRDSNYSHPIGEINCFYALTECFKSSALQVERNLGFEDYVPLNLKAGEYAILNTSIYKHGDILNKTNKTRISMDFRFIPDIQLKNNKSSLTKGIKFTSSSYFIKERELKNLNQ